MAHKLTALSGSQFQATGFAGGHDFTLPELIGSILLLITPAGIIAAVIVVLSRKELSSTNEQRQSLRLFLFTTGLPLLVFILFSLSRTVKLNWTGPLWLGFLPFMAHLMVSTPPICRPFLRVRINKIWWPTTVILLMCYGFGLHYLTIGFAGLPYPRNELGKGWPEIATKIEQVVQGVARKSGLQPLVVGMSTDSLSCWLAFYRTRVQERYRNSNTGVAAMNTGGRHLFGKPSHMYSYWFPSEPQIGRPMVLVGKSHLSLTGETIENYFDSMGAIQNLPVKKNGAQVWQIYYRIGYGYQPNPE